MGFKELISEYAPKKKCRELEDGYLPVIERLSEKNKVKHNWVHRYNLKNKYWRKAGKELIEFLFSERPYKKKRVNFPKLRKLLKKNRENSCYPDLVELTAVVYESIKEEEEKIVFLEDSGQEISLGKEQIREASICLLADALASQDQQPEQTLAYLGFSDGGNWLGVDLEEAGFKNFCRKDVWSAINNLRKDKKTRRKMAMEYAENNLTILDQGLEPNLSTGNIAGLDSPEEQVVFERY